MTSEIMEVYKYKASIYQQEINIMEDNTTNHLFSPLHMEPCHLNLY